MSGIVRELLASLSVAVLSLLLLFAAPDPTIEEAHLDCPGGLERTFPDMGACEISMQPGCSCVRPLNPWSRTYRWLMPIAIAGAAVALYRSNLFVATRALGITLSATGMAALAVLNASDSINNVQTLNSAIALVELTVITVALYAVLRIASILWTRVRRDS